MEKDKKPLTAKNLKKRIPYEGILKHCPVHKKKKEKDTKSTKLRSSGEKKKENKMESHRSKPMLKRGNDSE